VCDWVVAPYFLGMKFSNNPNCICQSSYPDQNWTKILASGLDITIFGLRTGAMHHRQQKQRVSARYQCRILP